MFSRLLTLIIKELITLLRDKQTRMILIMPVILQIVLFPAAATLEVKNASIAIYNQDNGQASSEIIQRLGRSKAFSNMLLLNSNQEIAPAINNEKALLFIQFPANFSRDLLNGQQTQLQLILDGRHSNSAQIAANYVQQIILQYQSEVMHTQLPAQLIIRNWYNPNLDYKWFVVPSLVALIATISILIVTSLSIAREREQGTMEQLLVSPLIIPQIFIGKAIPALIVSCLQATIVLLAGIFIYHISFQGSLLLFYFCLLIYGLSLVGFGLLISSFCNTQQQSFIGVMVFMMPMILLSGYVSPVENMPVWLQHVTWINPIRHFTNITKMIYLKNADFIAVWQSLWPLLVIAAVTGTLAYWMFKRKIA